jgi:cytochrome c biogenesis protein
VSKIDSSPPPEANPDLPDRPRRAGGALGFVRDSVRMGWRWLTRMRTALYLLGIIAVETLIATLVPQEPNVAATVARWRAGTDGPGQVVSGLIDLIGGYDVYGSPIFLFTLVLLFTSLTACLLPRIRAWWRLVRHARPPRTRHLGRQDHVAHIRTDRGPDEALATARGLLAGRRWRLRDPDIDPDAEPQVAAEKGLVVREGGSLLFHLSFYVLLVAIVLGQLLGFVGQVGIVEGRTWTETAVAYWSYEPGRWFGDDDHTGFQMTLDEFHVDWHRDPAFGGTPKLFATDVTITRPDGSTRETTIAGNVPLVEEGMKIHMLDWGYAPRVVITEDGETVHDAFLTINATEDAYFAGAAKAPGADPDVGLELFLFPYAPEGEDGQPSLTGAPWADAPLLLVQSYTGDLQLSASQNVNELETSALEQGAPAALRPGQSADLGDGVTVSFPELRRWVGFQVSYRPTVPFLLLGAGLLLLGLIPALYAYRRRLWVGAERAEDGSTRVTVAGRAFQRPQAFDDEFAGLVRRLTGDLAGTTDDVGDGSGPGADSPADEAVRG